ncbi:uncharacterized protein [Primulina huaijiensis]|uniref:uncharacterized protein isoform X6 n=1 Tax=Primulina huaijiensis TaxID=1492673 RepID=UPI003CC75F53
MIMHYSPKRICIPRWSSYGVIIVRAHKKSPAVVMNEHSFKKANGKQNHNHPIRRPSWISPYRKLKVHFSTKCSLFTFFFILFSSLGTSLMDVMVLLVFLNPLQSLRRDRVLRVFKLNTGQDDHAIMFMDDYVKQIEGVTRRLEEKKKNDVTVFEWFKMHVIQSKLDTSIEHEELCSLLSLGGVVKEDHITQLINAGLLVCQLIDRNMYWFSIPNIGSVLKGLSQEGAFVFTES